VIFSECERETGGVTCVVFKHDEVELVGYESIVEFVGYRDDVELVGCREDVELVGYKSVVELVGCGEDVELVGYDTIVEFVGCREEEDVELLEATRVVAELEQAGLAVTQAHSALAEFSTAIAVKPQAPTTQPAPAA
jgi:hypothetical protein